MTVDELSIEMLPARHGDALWVEWGSAGDRHRMLIDGGPKATYQDVRARFDALDVSDRHVDLFIVTHIDADHIDGAIKLLADDDLGVTYSDIWFNEHRHLGEDRPETTRGAMQGEYFGAVLERRGLPLNVAFDEGAVVVPPDGPLPSVDLDGGLRLVLLSPTPSKLEKLRANWEKVLAEKDMDPGDREEALERYEGRTRGGPKFGGDTSPANGSSIAVVAEYGSERWLLAGDAHDDVLLDGLRRYSRECDEWPVRLDGFKVADHGSVNNITPALLGAMDCRRFLVSTNGAYFRHPDEACIDLIVDHAEQPDLEFNYRTEFNEKWSTSSDSFVAVFDAASGDGERRERGDSGPVEEAGDTIETASRAVAPDPAVAPDLAEDLGTDDEVAPEPTETSSEFDRSTPESGALKVTVYHGSLERADDPVLVGHYAGTPLSGAEGFVDRRYQGRLTDRLVRGGYPGHLGESRLILGARRRFPRSGVVVVGLGEYGELTPPQLTATLCRALVDLALDEADRSDDADTLELGMSSVLIGATGDQGLSLSASVRAIVTAVRQANRELGEPDGTHRARYFHLALWERGGAEAELAFRALHSLFDDDQSLDEIVANPELWVATGALKNRLVPDSTEIAWWRVRVTTREDDLDAATQHRYLRLRYSMSGNLARADDIEHDVEVDRLQRLLGESVIHPRSDSRLHAALFELLFPNELKRRMSAAQDLLIEVDDATADLPWEMLSAESPGSDRTPLAVRARMIRQLRLSSIPSIRRADSAKALVIGNPPAGRLGPPLQGAFDEAKRVADVLGRHGYEVDDRCFSVEVKPNSRIASDIETTLLTGGYRIVHIAAHGVFDAEDPTRSGVVIGPEPGEFLTARFFQQVDIVPDLVFLNCCHLGAIARGLETEEEIDVTSTDPNRLGSSLARQLIDAGVRSVVVAGWAVDDAAAETFAAVLYGQMLGGAKFGDAVFKARIAARRTAPDHSTWGAYQCYGDGEHRLPRNISDASAALQIPPPITVAEARRRIESMVVSIESLGIEADRDRAEAELLDIERTAKERDWFQRDDGRLCEDLAAGWAAIGDHDHAIRRLDQALEATGGGATMRSLEQRTNLAGRLAAQLLRSPEVTDDDRERAHALMDQAFDSLGVLETISKTGERSALRGGHHKRLAAAAEGQRRSDHLRQAIDGYREAFESQQETYVMLNFVQLEEICARAGTGESEARHLYDRVAELVDAPVESSSGNFWSAVGSADSLVTLAIIRDDLPNKVDEIVDRYETAFDSGSTAKDRDSSLSHLLDLLDLHPDPEQSRALRKVYDSLRPAEASTAGGATATTDATQSSIGS